MFFIYFIILTTLLKCLFRVFNSSSKINIFWDSSSVETGLNWFSAFFLFKCYFMNTNPALHINRSIDLWPIIFIYRKEPLSYSGGGGWRGFERHELGREEGYLNKVGTKEISSIGRLKNKKRK